jgi:2-dehydro-3-deoxy-D-arabinonate dehydratase
MHEVWASGVTYLRSREARQAESEVGDVYARVYDAARPELFLKAIGWRVMGPGAPIRVRDDSQWDVPEPELTLVINCHHEIVGFCVGNDVSSRSIEGQNPLYLPQAKIYTGSCALGPGIQIASMEELVDLPVAIEIFREDVRVFQGQIRTSRMKRKLDELVVYLTRDLVFPQGVFLMTGTGIVPPDDFTLEHGDTVRITIGDLTLENKVA